MLITNTKNYSAANGEYYCAYCNEPIEVSEEVDDQGYVCNMIFECFCKQALIEKQMNEEINNLEKQIDCIREKYSEKLKVDYDKVQENQYKIELQELKNHYGKNS